VRAFRGQRGQALILLAAWLFFSGGASTALLVYERPASQVKKAVKRAITDPGRREAALIDINRWESIQEIHDEQVSADRKKILKAMRRKDAQRSDVEGIAASLDKTFFVMDWDFLNMRFQVKQRVTPAEWAEIVARP
jgi:PHD/YefM family antitoxin component YafN of YafNO toxin-antitoxin module